MKIFNKILIANRGEIALRIIRSVKEMGIHACVVFAEDERNAWFVKEADESYSLGSGALSDTYLNISKIIEIARQNKICAIHPGYGFLAENAAFAESCENNNIIFIGPSADSISLMGNKVAALQFVSELGVPLLESIRSISPDNLISEALKLPLPIIVKAAAGGGGKGMRIIRLADELKNSVEAASREAMSYFGNSEIYIERYINNPRHIEVQILGDKHGNVVHLFDRECTIQRRHQKIIEEAPSATLNVQNRANLLQTAVEIARKMQYVSAGTIEFLLDEKDNFYFLEMNTRIQVEHAVTEKITGIDIVKEQILIAQGYPVSQSQQQISVLGHAIECRIYAEDPFNNFIPSSGFIHHYIQPEQPYIRVDSSVNSPAEVLPDYDPMVSKVVSFAPTRMKAINLMDNYLKRYIIHGINTNLEYLCTILEHPAFLNNRISTNFCYTENEVLQQCYNKKIGEINKMDIVGSILFYLFTGEENSPSVWQSIGHWRQRMNIKLKIADEFINVVFKKLQQNKISFFTNELGPLEITGRKLNNEVFLEHIGNKPFAIVSNVENKIYCTIKGITFIITRKDLITLDKTKELTQLTELTNRIIAPINGKIIKVDVKPDDKVNKGDIIMVIESMKMENSILAPREGIINQVMVKTGDRVMGKDVVALLS
jgi:3-methylcrotonyl-CoA carboxylase alpha subunit